MTYSSSGPPSWTFGSSSSQVRHTNEGLMMDNIHVDPRKQELLEARFLGGRNRTSFDDKAAENNFVIQKQPIPNLSGPPQSHSAQQPPLHPDNSNLSSGASFDHDDSEVHLHSVQTPEKGKPVERKRKRKSLIEGGDAALKTIRAETNGKKINEYFKNQSPGRGHQSGGTKSPSPQAYHAV